jgi:hypothetical protein
VRGRRAGHVDDRDLSQLAELVRREQLVEGVSRVAPFGQQLEPTWP